MWMDTFAEGFLVTKLEVPNAVTCIIVINNCSALANSVFPQTPSSFLYHRIGSVIGVNPSFYEYLFMVDADTTVDPLPKTV